jgi:NAD(P)-dependent dehydrogenase (short-subunit alcohol dehydrogenase family)
VNTAQVALITGASGGLGSVVTPMFREAGYRVSAVALDWKNPSPAADAELVLQADLTVSSEAESVVAKTLDQLGRIDFLIHLVGIYIRGARVEDTTDETWNKMFDGNLRTAFNMMRAVIPHMRSRGFGRIVVIGGSAAFQPTVTFCTISATMAGLCALVQVAGAELRHEGVTVNALHPTTINTPFVRAMYPDQEEEHRKWVDPRALGSLMLWLCSDAGRDVTGAQIPVPARQPHPCYEWHGVTDRVK